MGHLRRRAVARQIDQAQKRARRDVPTRPSDILAVRLRLLSSLLGSSSVSSSAGSGVSSSRSGFRSAGSGVNSGVRSGGASSASSVRSSRSGVSGGVDGVRSGFGGFSGGRVFRLRAGRESESANHGGSENDLAHVWYSLEQRVDQARHKAEPKAYRSGRLRASNNRLRASMQALFAQRTFRPNSQP